MGFRAWVSRTFGLTDHDAIRAVAGRNNESGVRVTEHSALQLSAAWACVRLLSETVGMLPMNLYRKTETGLVLATEHPLYRILKHPNADQTGLEFWEATTAHICLNGNSYAVKNTIGKRLVGLTHLDSAKVRIERTENGALRYVVTDQGKRTEYPEDKILHIRGFGYGGDIGLTPINHGANSFGGALALDRTAAKTAAKMRPSGVLETDRADIKPEQREQIRKNVLNELDKGLEREETMLLEAGFTYKAISFNPSDAQLLETRRFNIEEICRWFRVPPMLIGHAAQGQTMWGTGVEQINLAWLTTGLAPFLTRIEKRAEKSLLAPEEKGQYQIKFNVEALLRADSAARAEFYSKMVQNGIYSRNAVRELENLPKIDGLDGITVQSNLLPIELLGKVKPSQTSDKEK